MELTITEDVALITSEQQPCCGTSPALPQSLVGCMFIEALCEDFGKRLVQIGWEDIYAVALVHALPIGGPVLWGVIAGVWPGLVTWFCRLSRRPFSARAINVVFEKLVGIIDSLKRSTGHGAAFVMIRMERRGEEDALLSQLVRCVTPRWIKKECNQGITKFLRRWNPLHVGFTIITAPASKRQSAQMALPTGYARWRPCAESKSGPSLSLSLNPTLWNYTLWNYPLWNLLLRAFAHP